MIRLYFIVGNVCWLVFCFQLLLDAHYGCQSSVKNIRIMHVQTKTCSETERTKLAWKLKMSNNYSLKSSRNNRNQMNAQLSRDMTKPTKWVCTQRRLRSAWASAQTDQSSLCAHWVAKDPSFLHVDGEDSDQTGRMPRLIWVLARCTVIF